MTVTAQLRRAAVLGKPVAHSLSPVLHMAAYRALGLRDWRYDAIECDVDHFPDFVRSAGPEWVGVSLTLPLKKVAMAVGAQASPLAQAVGAANTLLFTRNGMRVENTDVEGMTDALREAGVASVTSALVLGAGGTAQAALAALKGLGAESPIVLVRDGRRTADLQAAADRLGVKPRVMEGLHDRVLPEADVVICTLPPGAADSLRIQGAPPRVVLDVVYSPWPTPFASSAISRGVRVVGGFAMLLHQAVAQVALMTGMAPPVDAMRAALDPPASAR